MKRLAVLVGMLSVAACSFDPDVALIDEPGPPADNADEGPGDPATQPDEEPPPSPPGTCIVWETDFDVDPRVDANGDGVQDFALRRSDDDEELDIDQGLWFAPANLALDTAPKVDFVGTTRVQVIMRPVDLFSRSQFWIQLDHVGGQRSPIFAEVQEVGLEGLLVSLYAKRSDQAPVLLTSALVIEDFVDLELHAQAATDTVTIRVNQVDLGTHEYFSFPSGNNERFATLVSRSGDTAFDYLRVENCP